MVCLLFTQQFQRHTYNSTDDTQFKVKKTTKFQKIFDAFTKRHNLDVGSVRFMMDGDRIQGTDNPKMVSILRASHKPSTYFMPSLKWKTVTKLTACFSKLEANKLPIPTQSVE